jgi:membrane dipeptidase
MPIRYCRLAAVLLAGVILPPSAANATPNSAAAVQGRVLPFDPHLDIGVDFDSAAVPATVDGNTQFDLPKAARGGLKAAGLAVFVPQDIENDATLASARATADAKHRIIIGLAARYPTQVGLAHSPEELRRIVASHRLAVVETIVNGGAFVASLDDLDVWAAKGVQIFGFVHAGHNRLADSSRPAFLRGETTVGRWGGLSPLGKQALERLNRLGVLIDVSQLSDAAFADVLKLSKAPVIASHSDVRALVDTGRNLPDAQLDALKTQGGVIAINAFSSYLRPHDAQYSDGIAALNRESGVSDATMATLDPGRSKAYQARATALHAAEPKATVADLVNAVDYAVKRIGIDHVALSSDFNHGGGVIGWMNEGETGNVTAELLRHGYDGGAIAKLWSGNLLRVWAAAQAEGRALRK